MVQVVTRCVCLHLNLALTVCVGDQLAGISASQPCREQHIKANDRAGGCKKIR